MKRIPALLAALLLSLSLAACSTAGESASETSDPPASSSAPAESVSEPESSTPVEEEPAATGEGALGDYYVKLTGVAVSTDYEGNPALIVNYDFTNNGAESAAAIWSINISVFQNGLELETAIMTSDDYDSGQSMREVQTGTTISCQDAFALEDTTSPVEVQVEELISFDGEMIAQTYEIA